MDPAFMALTLQQHFTCSHATVVPLVFGFSPCFMLSLSFKKYFMYLCMYVCMYVFLEKGKEGRKRVRNADMREKHQSAASSTLPSTKPATRASSLTGNQTSDLLLRPTSWALLDKACPLFMYLAIGFFPYLPFIWLRFFFLFNGLELHILFLFF